MAAPPPIFGFAGLHVLTDRTTVEEAADRYTVATDLDTRGLASVFVDLRSHSEVHGRLTKAEAHPFEYRADMRLSELRRSDASL